MVLSLFLFRHIEFKRVDRRWFLFFNFRKCIVCSLGKPSIALLKDGKDIYHWLAPIINNALMNNKIWQILHEWFFFLPPTVTNISEVLKHHFSFRKCKEFRFSVSEFFIVIIYYPQTIYFSIRNASHIHIYSILSDRKKIL